MSKKLTKTPAELIIIGCIFCFVASCSLFGSSNAENKLTAQQQEVISYFKDIAVGLEYGGATQVTRKWRQDMKIFVGGAPNEELQAELQSIIDELNQLIPEGSISITTVADSSQSNAYLYFGKGQEFAERVPAAEGLVDDNYGLFYFWWEANFELYRMAAYVDTQRTESSQVRKHLLREELTQSLGLPKDSPKFSDSIFNSSYSIRTTSYSKRDKQLIQLLYHPELEPGLDSDEVDKKLKEIIEDVVPG